MKRYSERFSIGLTGGIGSGKTTVTNHFSSLGIKIVDADDVSRSITAAGNPAVKKIADLFGEQILEDTNTLDRNKLRELVFDNPEKKQKLEQLLHPLIRQRMRQLASQAESAYIIFSIPLLIETGQVELFDRILIVDATDEQRIKWIMQRSKISLNEVGKIINSQTSRENRLSVADDIISNNGGLTELYKQVESLHQKYQRIAKNTT